jgi:hypothetical protein
MRTSKKKPIKLLPLISDETTFDKIQRLLHEDPAVVKRELSPKELELKTRYLGTFTYMLEHPSLIDIEIVRWIQNTFQIQKSQAWRDVPKVKLLLGNVAVATETYLRYTLIEMAKETYAIAKQKGDPKAMAAAMDKFGKYTRLDHPEIDKLPFDSIVPPEFEPAYDTELLPPKQAANIDARREKLRKKYLGGDGIEEANVIDES